MYTGYLPLFLRTQGVMNTYFICLDQFRRKTNLMNYFWGQFIVASISASLAWTVIWPFEILKNIIQAETKEAGHSYRENFRFIVQERGIKGLFRGWVPGVCSVSIRNGASMIVMQKTNAFIASKGFRNKSK